MSEGSDYSGNTGFLFALIIGWIFLIGGIVFMVFLDDNRFLFGVPYALLGLVIVVGMIDGRRRRVARERREEAEARAAEGSPPSGTAAG
ncbi:MAG: hypothetical protein KDC33_03100 [Thermoleophilia bacterium]|nr:hypothetical protein [Thermoleophilia bacterium]